MRVWQVVLYVSPVTVAMSLMAIFLCTLLIMFFRVREPAVVPWVSRFFLAVWVMVIGVATLSVSQSLGAGGTGVWLIPFHTLFLEDHLLGSGERDMYIRQLTANALMFVPLPILVRASFVRVSAAQSLLACMGLSVLIEVTQWLQSAGRVADIDDLLLNFFGAALGAGIYLMSACAVSRMRRWPLLARDSAHSCY
ncbi:VanZ family protein [Streptomyces sp. ACA25]|uniref:VanZ family protein n=1 Tax=Streptomyces sp. ACA25 TaxID=3022596 RepID=UPI0023081A4E|nr:VanZ family protein [Streptomyces sp. ACA25]MDB1088679.1 VanZ family protein [Streptomyces sp. ACA25]